MKANSMLSSLAALLFCSVAFSLSAKADGLVTASNTVHQCSGGECSILVPAEDGKFREVVKRCDQSISCQNDERCSCRCSKAGEEIAAELFCKKLTPEELKACRG